MSHQHVRIKAVLKELNEAKNAIDPQDDYSKGFKDALLFIESLMSGKHHIYLMEASNVKLVGSNFDREEGYFDECQLLHKT